LPLFLQKESGFQGKALRISTGEKAFCTLFTDERLKKVDKNFKLSSTLCSITRVQMAKALCRVWDSVPQNDFAIALLFVSLNNAMSRLNPACDTITI
jgi:hypothetical protein